jgi:hypothetical protein
MYRDSIGDSIVTSSRRSSIVCYKVAIESPIESPLSSEILSLTSTLGIGMFYCRSSPGVITHLKNMNSLFLKSPDTSSYQTLWNTVKNTSLMTSTVFPSDLFPMGDHYFDLQTGNTLLTN